MIPAQRVPGEDVLEEDAAAGGIFVVSGPRGEQPCCSGESPAADQPSRLLRLSRRPGACRCAKKSWEESKRLVPLLAGVTAGTRPNPAGSRYSPKVKGISVQRT